MPLANHLRRAFHGASMMRNKAPVMRNKAPVESDLQLVAKYFLFSTAIGFPVFVYFIESEKKRMRSEAGLAETFGKRKDD
ncbi:unnamed protein product [Rhodiola kirilowii]